MKNPNPLFETAIHYQIMVQGRVDVEWLKSFNSSVEIAFQATRRVKDVTVLNVHTDQSGIIGLVRRLHGLGITIQQLKIVSEAGYADEVEDENCGKES